MNIKNRTFFLVSLIIILLSGFYLYEGISQYNKEIDNAIHAEETVIDDITRDINAYSFHPYLFKIRHFIATNEKIRQAFADRDRARLYELALPMYRYLQDENNYFHAMDFNLPDGTVFLRVQKPELYGDDISQSRPIVVAVHQQKEQLSGFDIGKHGAIFWVTEPIRYQGEYVGAVEFGIEVQQLQKALEERFKRDVATIIKANQWQKATFASAGFRNFGDYILLTHGESVFEHIPAGFDFDVGDQRLVIDGKENILHACSILKDHQGGVIGRVLVLQDISGELLKKNVFIKSALLLTGLLLIVSFVVLYLSFGSLIGRLEVYALENQQAKDALQAAHDELEQRVEQRTTELAAANIALKQEIIDRTQAENKINEQWAFLQNIIESLTHPFYVIDAQSYEIVLANKAACALQGGQTFAGLTCYGMTHNQTEPCSGQEHPCPLQEVKRQRVPVIVEHTHMDQDGDPRTFEIYAYPIFGQHGEIRQVIEYDIDVTGRKESEKEREALWGQLVHAQKLEAVGILAGGVAHDFNNVLTTILGYSQIIAMKLPEGDPTREMVEEIHSAGERAAGLTRQLLAFSSKQVMEMRIVNLNMVVEDMAKMLGRLIGENIVMSILPAKRIGNIKADVGQIEQILMNLVVNSRDAMPDGGILTIETGELFLDEDYARRHSDVTTGTYAVLTVTDNGAGMSQEIQEKIFDPFFTTKEHGKGTGLGLATVYGIVKQHYGHIYVYSEPGRGTTFKIYFPLISEPVEETDSKRTRTMPRGSERILVVDDDSAIRRLVCDTLEPLGYETIEAESGADALKQYGNSDEKIDLVLSDLIMPGINGREFIKALAEIRPGIKAILMSGYTDNVVVHQGVLDPGIIFLNKPLLPIALANKIRAVLDGSGKTSAG